MRKVSSQEESFHEKLARHLRAVGGATTLTLAAVLAFASVVAGLATTLTLTAVLAFTRVLILGGQPGKSGLTKILAVRRHRVGRRVRSGSMESYRGKPEHSAHRCTQHDRFHRLLHCESSWYCRLASFHAGCATLESYNSHLVTGKANLFGRGPVCVGWEGPSTIRR
jgi:hypothetical protein